MNLISSISTPLIGSRLAKKFETGGKKRTEAKSSKAALAVKHRSTCPIKPNRDELVDRLQQMIAEYNAGSLNDRNSSPRPINSLTPSTKKRTGQFMEKPHRRELAYLRHHYPTIPELDGCRNEPRKKALAKELLVKLKESRRTRHGAKQQQTRAGCARRRRNRTRPFTAKVRCRLFQAKCDLVYQHIYDSLLGRRSQHV